VVITTECKEKERKVEMNSKFVVCVMVCCVGGEDEVIQNRMNIWVLELIPRGAGGQEWGGSLRGLHCSSCLRRSVLPRLAS